MSLSCPSVCLCMSRERKKDDSNGLDKDKRHLAKRQHSKIINFGSCSVLSTLISNELNENKEEQIEQVEFVSEKMKT